MSSSSTTKEGDDKSNNINNKKKKNDDGDGGDGLTYMNGFGNGFESECLPGALPVGRNNPRSAPYGLFAEQLSGTPFTLHRRHNRRTWLYRTDPSVAWTTVRPSEPWTRQRHLGGAHPSECRATIDPLRWRPVPLLHHRRDGDDDDCLAFLSGMRLVSAAGDPEGLSGLAVYVYGLRVAVGGGGGAAATTTTTVMPKHHHRHRTGATTNTNTHCCNGDGHFLLVPQRGGLLIRTELGRLTVRPTEIAVIPRGLVFSVQFETAEAKAAGNGAEEEEEVFRGYVLEVYGHGGFQLPELGPIGSNGLANARDFQVPTAWTDAVRRNERGRQQHTLVVKLHSQLFQRALDGTPYNVVAWHGNYVPYKYDLTKFCAVNSVSYDHPDPSIYTVLTCPCGDGGTAVADLVIFPPRWQATDPNTFRPPWFHRNCCSEYMGLIYGQYDAKEGGSGGGGGFVPGGASLHNSTTPHGPDAATYRRAVADECGEPTFLNSGMAFMFETALPLRVAPHALDGGDDGDWRDAGYATCWEGLSSADQFTGWDLLKEQQAGKEKPL
jgi:homogentisate 1,2-dioxygenase